jgi:hypothetical protein
MHIVKDIFESTVDTLFDIPGKTKDKLRTHKHLQKFEIKPQL